MSTMTVLPRSISSTFNKMQKLMGTMSKLMEEYSSGRLPSLVRSLSMREKQVLHLARQGKSRRVMAKELGVSPKTISTIQASIVSKLGLNGSRDLKSLGFSGKKG